MSDYLECAVCGSSQFQMEWDRVECEKGHGLDGVFPPEVDANYRKEIDGLRAEVDRLRKVELAFDALRG